MGSPMLPALFQCIIATSGAAEERVDSLTAQELETVQTANTIEMLAWGVQAVSHSKCSPLIFQEWYHFNVIPLFSLPDIQVVLMENSESLAATPSVGDAWKSALATSGDRSVTLNGTTWMPKWPADSLASHQLVNTKRLILSTLSCYY